MLIFVSSTFKDLREERLAAQEALRAAPAEPWGMEFFASEPSTPLDVALRELRNCDAVVLIIGFYAGSLIPESLSTTYTQAEYEEALKLARPVFTFIKVEDGEHQNKETNVTKQQVLDEFLNCVRSGPHTPEYFSNIDQLKYQILRAITRWTELGRPGARKTFAEIRPPALPTDVQPLFDFDQSLQGRSDEMARLDAFLSDPLKLVAVLPGRGGIGKTKLSRTWATTLVGWTPLWVNPAGTWHRETGNEIPSGDVVVIADDAHRYEHLGKLVALIANVPAGRKVKLLIGTRPSGISYVSDTLARALDDTRVTRFEHLTQLKLKETAALAKEVLGPEYEYLAPVLAEISRDAPLVTVVGGRLVARGQIPPAQLANEYSFRRMVFDRFIEDCEGQLPAGGRPKRELLNLLAALQPISPKDQGFIVAAEKFLGMRKDQILQGTNALEEAGVLTRTGDRVRIVPDVLADYLLEGACINTRDETTGFAEAVFQQFRETFLSNLLRNLAELDWRIAQRAESSKLLSAVWEQLIEEFKSANAEARSNLLNALKAVAPFQPGPTMEIVRIAMDTEAAEQKTYFWTTSQQDVLSDVPDILQGVAYETTLLGEVVSRLWRLAMRKERRVQDESVQALKGLVAYKRYKPVQINKEMADLVAKLADDPAAFDGEFTPLDLLDELLDREVDYSELNGRTFTMSAVPLNYDNVRETRDEALSTIDSLLYSSTPRASSRAIRSLEKIISGYLPKFGRVLSPEEIEWQNDERMRALDMFRRRIRAPSLHIPLARQIKCTLRGLIPRDRKNAVLLAAQAVLGEIPTSGELFIFDAICTGDWDRDLEFDDLNEASHHHRQQVDEAVRKLRVLHPDPKQQICAVEGLIKQAREFGISINGADSFLTNLCGYRDFLKEFSNYLLHGDPLMGPLAGVALRTWREVDRTYFAEFGRILAAHNRADIAYSCAIATCYGPNLNAPLPEDVGIVKVISRRTEPEVLVPAFFGVARLGRIQEFEMSALEIALAVQLPDDSKIANEYCNIFNARGIDPHTVGQANVKNVLDKLVPVRELDHHNTGAFLYWVSSNHPGLLFEFLLKRLEFYRALKLEGESGRYQPIAHSGSWINFTGLRGTDVYPKFLAAVRDMVIVHPGEQYWLSALFWSAATFDEVTSGVLREWLQSGDEEKLHAILGLLSEAPSGLAVAHPDFAVEMIEASARFGAERKTIGRLVANSLSYNGVWSAGTVPTIFADAQLKATDLANRFPADSAGCRFFRELATVTTQRIDDIQLEDAEDFPE